MKSFIRWFIQGIALLWLLWWGIWALLLPFSRYESLSLSLPDCDSEGELVAGVSMWIIWLTTALILGVNIYIKIWRRVRMLELINILAVALSISSIVRHRELIQYSESVQPYCR